MSYFESVGSHTFLIETNADALSTLLNGLVATKAWNVRNRDIGGFAAKRDGSIVETAIGLPCTRPCLKASGVLCMMKIVTPKIMWTPDLEQSLALSDEQRSHVFAKFLRPAPHCFQKQEQRLFRKELRGNRCIW